MSQTVVYCPSCGHELPSGAGFCGDCGHALTARAPTPAPPARFCRDCGGDQPAGAEFCRACGASQAAEKSAIAAAAPAPPAIRVAAADPPPPVAADPAPPPAPVAAHSSWLAAPPSSPEAEADAPSPAAFGAPPFEPPAPAEPAPGGLGGGESPRRPRTLLVGSLVVLLLAAGGAAAYLTLGNKKDDRQTAANLRSSSTARPTSTPSIAEATPAAADSDPTSTATPSPTPSPTTTPDAGVLPEGPPAQFTQDIRAVLVDFHRAIVAHDDRAAWNLLSARKRSKELREDGYAKWRAAQESLAPYLDPAGLEVTVRDVDRRTGVALVAVSGMKWSAPDARCSDWTGLTWVKYEGGEWRYDPGFSTTPQRRREWKNRYQELLGASC